jgi:hypothetical protein
MLLTPHDTRIERHFPRLMATLAWMPTEGKLANKSA